MTFSYLTIRSCSRTSLIIKARNSLVHLLLSLEAHRQEDISKFPIQKSLMSRSLIVPSTGNPRAWKLAAPLPPPLRPARARARSATKEIEYPRRRFSRLSLPFPPASRLFLTPSLPISRPRYNFPGQEVSNDGKSNIYRFESRRFRRRSLHEQLFL